MNIEIRRLTPKLLEDYLNFFDNTPHSTNKPEHRCYCVCWSSKNCEGTDFSSAEKRRDIAKEYVRDGHIKVILLMWIIRSSAGAMPTRKKTVTTVFHGRCL